MTLLWWANERSTEPPVVRMLPDEDRKITVGLSSAISAGEAILTSNMEAEVYHYRHGTVIDPTPKSAILSYDGQTKVAAQKINSSLLPPNVPCVLVISFDVNTAGGNERRSVFIILVAGY